MRNVTKILLSGFVGAATAVACGALILIKKRDQYIKREDLYDNLREILENPTSISDILDGKVVDIANKYGGEEEDAEISSSTVSDFSPNKELTGNNASDKNEDSNDEK